MKFRLRPAEVLVLESLGTRMLIQFRDFFAALNKIRVTTILAVSIRVRNNQNSNVDQSNVRRLFQAFIIITERFEWFMNHVNFYSSA